jgi:hypothetical protein
MIICLSNAFLFHPRLRRGVRTQDLWGLCSDGTGMTFFGLLVVLLLPDGCFDASLIALAGIPLPIPE